MGESSVLVTHVPPARARRRKYLAAAGLLLLVTMWGCDQQKVLEQARARGAQAGRDDGRRAGEADGYKAVFEDAKGAVYAEMIGRLYSSGDYRRRGTYTALAIGGTFILGFTLQYFFLYLLRRKRLLHDIDRIVLGKRATEMDLADLSGH